MVMPKRDQPRRQFFQFRQFKILIVPTRLRQDKRFQAKSGGIGGGLHEQECFNFPDQLPKNFFRRESANERRLKQNPGALTIPLAQRISQRERIETGQWLAVWSRS